MPIVKEKYFWMKANNQVEQIDWEKWKNLNEDKKRIRVIGDEVMIIHHNNYITLNRLALKAVMLNI